MGREEVGRIGLRAWDDGGISCMYVCPAIFGGRRDGIEGTDTGPQKMKHGQERKADIGDVQTAGMQGLVGNRAN